MNDELLKRLDVLGAKLGVTAQYLWAVLLKQARVEVISDISFLVLFAALGYVLLRISLWGYKSGNRDDNEGYFFLSFFSGGAAIICTIASIIYAVSIPTPLFNPEYFALNEVLKAMK